MPRNGVPTTVAPSPLDRVVTRARATVGADHAALVLRDEEGLLVLAAGDCGLEEAAGCVLDAARPVVIRETTVAAGVPVEFGGKLCGALCVRALRPGAIEEAQLELLGELAALAGDLIEHAE